MRDWYPAEIRERAVRSYESGKGSYQEVSELFEVSKSSLRRWVARSRSAGTVLPLPRGGGWKSPVAMALLHQVLAESPSATAEELGRSYNCKAPKTARVHVSSLKRALARAGYVFKKNAVDRRNKIVRTSPKSAKPSSVG